MPLPDEVTLVITELSDGSEEVTINIEEPAGPPGAPGATWLPTTGIPADGVGEDNDRAFDSADAQVYLKSAGTWAPEVNLKGSKGDTGSVGATWLPTTGIPADGVGADGDRAFDAADGQVYLKSAGTWAAEVNLKGAPGNDAVIADDSVQTSHLQDGAVTQPKIAAGAVTNTRIADNAVTQAKIASSAVTNTRLSGSSVSTEKIQDGAVTEPKLGAGAITESKLADGAVVRSKIHDPLGLQAGDRWAAEFDAAQKDQYGEFRWSATTAASAGLRLRIRATQLGDVSTYIVGRADTGYPAMQISASGSISAVGLGTTLFASVALADMQTHLVEFQLEGGTQSLIVDGVLQDSEVTATPAATLDAEYWVGKAQYNPTNAAGEYILYDAEWHDPADPNNSIFLRLDERTGNFRNAYRTPGDKLYNPSNTAAEYAIRNGDIGAVLVPQLEPNARGLTTRDLASASVRPAAYGGGDVANSLGHFGEFDFSAGAPPYRQNFKLKASVLATSGTILAIGRADGDQPTLYFQSDGAILAKVGSPSIGTSTTGLIQFTGDAQVFDGYFDVTATLATVVLRIDGEQVFTASVAGTFVAPTLGYRIGGLYSTAPRWSGKIWDVSVSREGTPARAAFFPMDELADEFVNRVEGSDVGNAERNGLVLAANVLDEDGGSAPVLAKSVYLHGGADIAAQAMTGPSTQILQIATASLNESGGLAAGSDDMFTVPSDGVIDMIVAYWINKNSDPADVADVYIYAGATSIAKGLTEVGAVSEYLPVSLLATAPVNAGDVIQVRFQSISATSSFSVLNTMVSIRFHPTPQ